MRSEKQIPIIRFIDIPGLKDYQYQSGKIVINTIILYPTSLGNLNSPRCPLKGNEGIRELDKDLEISFNTKDYYLNFSKEICEQDKIIALDLWGGYGLDLWGGEPTLHLERVTRIYKDFLDYYYNMRFLKRISSNWTTPDLIDKLHDLLDVYRNFPNRKFTVDLQISLSGPAEITDRYRGEGTTKKIIDNVDSFLNSKDKLPENVEVLIYPKSVVPLKEMERFLDKSEIVKYYRFFETEIHQKVTDIEDKRIRSQGIVVGTVTPYHYTQEDGLLFAKICKNFKEVEEENLNDNILKYHKVLTPFNLYGKPKPSEELTEFNLARLNAACGLVLHSVGLWPHGFINTCHRSYIDFSEDYYRKGKSNAEVGESAIREDAKYLFNFRKEDLDDYRKKIICYYRESTTQLSQLVLLIKNLAYCGQIEEKYRDNKTALAGANEILDSCGYCFHENLTETATLSCTYTGIIKLLLNGAVEFIDE
jgi:hypothetical protein